MGGRFATSGTHDEQAVPQQPCADCALFAPLVFTMEAAALSQMAAFNLVREVTTDLLRAQHENRLLLAENERLRQLLRKPSSVLDLPPSRRRSDLAALSDSEPIPLLDLPPSRRRNDQAALSASEPISVLDLPPSRRRSGSAALSDTEPISLLDLPPSRRRNGQAILSASEPIALFDLPPSRRRNGPAALAASDPISLFDLPPSSRRSDPTARESCGTQSDRPSLRPEECAVLYLAGQGCERGLESLREALLDHLRLLTGLEGELVSLAACNARQHGTIQELVGICSEHSSLLDALQRGPPTSRRGAC